jgi:hypothetical protein
VTISKTAALSLLISILFFGVFAILAFTGLFNLLETRFYNPSIAASIARNNDYNAEEVDKFLSEMQNRFSETLMTDAVRRSFMPTQYTEEAADRANIYRLLIESFSGIQWIRFVDSGGVRIHFSSYNPDIVHYEGDLPVYRNYHEIDLPYEDVAVYDGYPPRYIFDGKSARIIFSFPLYDAYDSYWGTALFSLSANSLLDGLLNEGRIRYGQDLTVISNPQGLLFEMASTGEKALPSQISSIWMEHGQKNARLISPISGYSLVLFTAKTSNGIFVGCLVNEKVFSLPDSLKLILLASCFLTVFLSVFLLFNLRQDPVAVVQARLKRLQISLIEQFYEIKTETDWSRWIRDLEVRREEIIDLVKQDIKSTVENQRADIDDLISKSWDELLSVLGGHRKDGVDEEQLRLILKSILSDLSKTPITSNLPPFADFPGFQPAVSVSAGRQGGLLMKATARINKKEILKEPDEIEALEELEELEELDAGEEETPSEPEAQPGPPRDIIGELASKIEFSDDPEPDSPLDSEISEDESIEEDLEVVSPFSGMVFDFSTDDDGQADVSMEVTPPGGDFEKPYHAAPMSPLVESKIPYANKHTAKPIEHKHAFLPEVETLPTVEDDDEDIPVLDESGIIEEREGIPYINEDALNPGPENLNRDLKNLVDSVIK